MTDSELIKALENSINTYNQKGIYVDTENLQQQVLDLIKRQKAEIEKLKGSTIVSNIMESQRIKREAKAEAEAYKEFAKRLKIYSCRLKDGHDMVDTICIDNLLKEMVGEEA